MDRHAVLIALSWGALMLGCDDEPQFDCTEMDGRADLVFCDDFSDGEAGSWTASGGNFSVSGGRYVGEGPDEIDGGMCSASMMVASIREGARSRDVRIHAELRSLERVDKVLVLRATDDANRIELNFRAAPYDDLMVQELVDCELIYFTEDGEVPLPHEMNERITVDVELRGDRLTVRRDGELVLDREFSFTNTEGDVGVAVIERGAAEFDSVWMERL